MRASEVTNRLEPNQPQQPTRRRRRAAERQRRWAADVEVSMRCKLSFVLRVALTVAVPAIAISLLWPIHWEARMTRVRGSGAVEHFSGTQFLRDNVWLQLGAIGGMLGWVYF